MNGEQSLSVRFRLNPSDARHHFQAAVNLGGLDPNTVRVELFADGREGEEPFRTPMERGARLPNGSFLYVASIGRERNEADFTLRVAPYHPGASVPLEANQILWQR